MSWIEDLNKERIFNYVCDDEVLSGTLQELSDMIGNTVEGVPGESLPFNGKSFLYNGFESVKMAGMSLIMYEQNGRKAYKIKDSSGKVRYIAKSKYDYLKHGEMNGKKLTRKGSASLMKGDET